MVLFLESLDALNDSGSPLDNQVFKAVSLIQVRIHELLHCFASLPTLNRLLVKLSFLLVNVLDKFFKLAQTQTFLVECG